MKILLIIPAYNEEESIEKVVREIEEKCPECDYVVVNDCSTDHTEEILKQKNFNHVSLSANLGIGGAVQTGYKYAMHYGYDIAIQQDGDGQHDPAYIQDVIQPIVQKEADLVIGSRFIEKNGFQSSFSRRAGVRFLCGVIRLVCGVKVTDCTSGYRAAGKELIAYFSRSYAQDYPEPEAIVSAALAGFKVKEVPVIMRERQGGVSSLNLMKSALYMIKVPLALVLRRLMMKRIRGEKR